MSNIDKQALRVPERKIHDWSEAVMRGCDFCNQWELTVKHDDGGCICASCCDSEYASDLKVTLVTALERLEAAENRIAELEARELKLPDVEKWRSPEAVRAQNAYRVLVRQELSAAGIITKVGE